MVRALTDEQLDQMVTNTMLVLLVRPDLRADWHSNLESLLQQAQDAALEDEALFVAAVLTLLYSPDDTMATGTVYDDVWQAILTGLQTGVVQPAASQSQDMTLDRLLRSVAEAVIAVMTRAQSQVETVIGELDDMRGAAVESGVTELVGWLDDILSLLRGTPPSELGNGHQGVYATYWDAVLQELET
jgi:hypothetical protein